MVRLADKPYWGELRFGFTQLRGLALSVVVVKPMRGKACIARELGEGSSLGLVLVEQFIDRG